jgi:AraC-like DNA-binding protein
LQRLAPALAARRTQVARSNATGAEAIPNDARFRARSTTRDRLDPAFDYIAKRYAHPISGMDVARTCGMSLFGFSRAFRAARGMTFRDYLCDYRLAQSKRLLANSAASIADVAAMSGFNDASYFARQFRKRLGISPTDWRDQQGARPQRQDTAETA